MSIDLSSKVGLPVTLLDNNKLEFGGGVDLDKMGERSKADLAIVAKEQNLKLNDDAAYYMYRNVHRVGDEDKLESYNQRFDLTVIPAGTLGSEHIKTSGDYHPKKEGTEVEFPELYYVVSGQATYLMQKHAQNGTIEDVIMARVKAGEAIVMPPFYGHVTINETGETLVMANWVEANFSSIYGDFEQKRGGAYYIMKDGTNIKNNEYGEVPELREMESSPMCIAELKDAPIYSYSEQIEKIDLLVNPEKHAEEFKVENLFKDKAMN